jgi:hypothetical protein
MQDSRLREAIRLCEIKAGPIGTIVATSALKYGTIMPDVAERALTKAGYVVRYNVRKATAECRVFAIVDKRERLAAYGCSPNGSTTDERKADALLLAILGAAREEEAAAVVAAYCAKNEPDATPTRRAELATAYIRGKATPTQLVVG